MFATLDTGLNLIHVADVARGHLLAARRGRVGEKYILGAENLSLRELPILEDITSIRAPRVRMPHTPSIWWRWPARDWLRPRPSARVPLTGVRMARKHMYFSAGKAMRELGLAPRPMAQALRDAVGWFVDYGYAPPPPAYRPRAA